MKNFIIKSISILMIMFVSYSCKEKEEEVDNKSGEQIAALEVSLNSLKNERNNADFGYKRGEYPPESVTILDNAMTVINALITKLYNGTVVTDDEVDAAKANATQAIGAFRATANSEDAPPDPMIDKFYELKKERDEAPYGFLEGQYPTESKQILQSAMNVLVELIGKMLAGQNVTATERQTAMAAADKAIEDFKATVRTEDFIHPDVVKLRVSLKNLEDEKDNATFGYQVDEYPFKSEEILNNAITVVSSLIDRINSGLFYSAFDVELAQTAASAAIIVFRATKRTQEAEKILWVDGFEDGYIDFGNSPSFTQFGPKGGPQKFTIEFWVKITHCDGPGSILSTLIERETHTIERHGWFINYWDCNRIRMSWALKNRENGDPGLWEPGFNFNHNNDGWVHIAAVFDDTGIDGSDRIVKLYQNGVQRNHEVGIHDSFNYWFDHDDEFGTDFSMIAFGQNDLFGRESFSTEKFRPSQGYMKHVRIWNSPKSPEEVQGLMNRTIEVTGNEPDLVCYWKFNEEVEGEIEDLTGRHKATIHGSHRWEYED